MCVPNHYDIDYFNKELARGIEQYVFTLKAPVELCIKRDSERTKYHGEGAAYAVHSLVSQFDYGTIIDVNKSLDDTIQDILSYLPRPKNS